MRQYNTISSIAKDVGGVYNYMNAMNTEPEEMKHYITYDGIYTNLGMTSVTENLPNLSLPIMGKDSHDNPIVFLDLRRFKHNRGEGTTIEDLTVRNGDKDSLIFLSKLLLTFDELAEFNSIKHEYMLTLSMFIYEQLSRVFLLNNIDKNFILTGVATYIMNMIDSEVTTEIVHYVLKQHKLILEDTHEIIDLIDLVKLYPSNLQGFVDYMKRIDKTDKLSKLSVEILTSTMITGSIGDINKKLILMSFEHPLPWLCLIRSHLKNMMLKKTFLTNNLKTFKRFTGVENILTRLDRI